VVLGGEYNESSEFLSANEGNVGNSPNLKDMHQREAIPIGCSNWHGKECNLQNLEGIFFVKGHVMASNPREATMEDILGQDHVDLTIFYYLGNILIIMIIWKWPLA
jgi:hypothetical protein